MKNLAARIADDILAYPYSSQMGLLRHTASAHKAKESPYGRENARL